MAKKIRINSQNINSIPNKNSHTNKVKTDTIKLFNGKRITKKKLIVLLSIMAVCVIGIYYFFFYGPSINKVKDSVVMIEVYDSKGELLGRGSGFCAFKSDLIVTNFHVIEGAHEIKIITNDKNRYEAYKVVVFDYTNDLAILKTNVNLTPLQFGYEYEIKTGKKIKTIGSPLGEMNTLSTGVISNADNDNGIQISAPISHGSSGGVLLDNRNRVIGVTYAGYDIGENLNFAINIKLLKKLYKKYQNGDYRVISNSSSGNNIDYTSCYLYFNNELKFKGCNLYSEDKGGLYSVDSIDMLFRVTDSFTIYDYIESERSVNKELYNSLSLSEKRLAADLYEEIDDNASVFKGNLDDMNIVDLMYAISKAEDNTFGKSNLSNAVAAIKEIENNNKCFNKVNGMSISIPEKRLLLLGICPSFAPGDLSNSDAQGFITDINNLNLSIAQKSTILRRFGYRVNDGNVNW